MNVLSDQELSRCKRRMFVIGMLFAAAVSAALHHWFYSRLVERIDSLQIVTQTSTHTVASIPTLRFGKWVKCTVVIDQRTQLWSITC